jgi:hypothetical protein
LKQKLEIGFRNAVEALNEMIVVSIKRKGDQVEANIAVREERSKLETDKQKSERKENSANEAATGWRRREGESYSLEDQAAKKLNLEQKAEDSRWRLHNIMRNMFYFGNTPLNSAKNETEKYRKERLSAAENALTKIEQATQWHNELIEIAHKLKFTTEKKTLSRIIIALHGCLDACHHIMTTIKLAVTYWENTAELCNRMLLSNTQMNEDAT